MRGTGKVPEPSLEGHQIRSSVSGPSICAENLGQSVTGVTVGIIYGFVVTVDL